MWATTSKTVPLSISWLHTTKPCSTASAHTVASADQSGYHLTNPLRITVLCFHMYSGGATYQSMKDTCESMKETWQQSWEHLLMKLNIADTFFFTQPVHVLTLGAFGKLNKKWIPHFFENSSKVVITGVRNHIIMVKVLRDCFSLSNLIEEDVIQLCISFLHTLHSGHTLLCCQFPLAPAYSTTFHSCEGLTYDKIGIDLTRPVFTHGQLYTALSRVRRRTDAKVRLRTGESTTTNITYHQLLLNDSM